MQSIYSDLRFWIKFKIFDNFFNLIKYLKIKVYLKNQTKLKYLKSLQSSDKEKNTVLNL